METINIASFPTFRDARRLEDLNRLVAVNRDLMPHAVMVATGCSEDEAFALLFLLVFMGLAEEWLLTYHENHTIDSPPLHISRVSEGFPQLPIQCPECNEEIEDPEELRYRLNFVLSGRIVFEGFNAELR